MHTHLCAGSGSGYRQAGLRLLQKQPVYNQPFPWPSKGPHASRRPMSQQGAMCAWLSNTHGRCCQGPMHVSKKSKQTSAWTNVGSYIPPPSYPPVCATHRQPRTHNANQATHLKKTSRLAIEHTIAQHLSVRKHGACVGTRPPLSPSINQEKRSSTLAASCAHEWASQAQRRPRPPQTSLQAM